LGSRSHIAKCDKLVKKHLRYQQKNKQQTAKKGNMPPSTKNEEKEEQRATVGEAGYFYEGQSNSAL
jgi:hypothetical protein